jgi:very-short-patch-repair endonuclease
MEPIPNIVIGQRIEETKVVRAKQLRRKMTAAERVLWNCLRSNRLGGFHFRRQQVIDGFIVDFYCHAAALIVEVDGPIHADQAEYDAERDRILGGRGFRILHVTNEKVMGAMAEVLQRIQALCGDEGRT